MKYPTGYMLSLALMAMAIVLPARAADLTVTMRKATPSGTGDTIGTVTISDSAAGATFKVNLHDLPPGAHGFHVHENDDCGPIYIGGVRIPAGAAGEHFDPDHTDKHEGPTGEGHLGDLPVLDVGADGTATQTLTAPRIKDIGMLKKRALIVEARGDNYKDRPVRDGGGGGRIACGVIE